jgi:hypothetical protein
MASKGILLRTDLSANPGKLMERSRKADGVSVLSLIISIS